MCEKEVRYHGLRVVHYSERDSHECSAVVAASAFARDSEASPVLAEILSAEVEAAEVAPNAEKRKWQMQPKRPWPCCCC